MKHIPILLILTTIVLAGNNQVKISGIVTDQNEVPLVYANVYIDGRLEGATSNSDGYFEFNVTASGNFTLICNYIGYREFRKKITLEQGHNFVQKIVLRDRRLNTK